MRTPWKEHLVQVTKDPKTKAWLSRVGLSLAPPALILGLLSPFLAIGAISILTTLVSGYVYLALFLAAENIVKYEVLGVTLPRDTGYFPVLQLLVASILWSGILANTLRPQELLYSSAVVSASLGWSSWIYLRNFRNFTAEWERQISEIDKRQREGLTTGTRAVRLGERDVKL